MNELLHTWHDSTTYSKLSFGDKLEDRVPHCWDYKTEKLRITVLNDHRDFPDRWVMHCHQLGMNTVLLKAQIETPVAEVQATAIRIVKRRLSEMLASLVAPENTPEQ